MVAAIAQRQEVNLYLPEFRRSRDLFCAARAAALVAVFCLVLVLVQIGLQWSDRSAQQSLRTAQQQLQSLQQRVAALRLAQPHSQHRQLQRQVADLQRQLQQGRRVSELIEAQNLGNSAGFSAQLRGMARQVPADLSLSRFRLSRGGGLVELQGRARRAEAVPRYLQRLHAEESFRKASFGTMVIERGSGAGLLHFSLGETSGGSGAS